MKRALVATALSLSLTAPAFADSIAVVDFDNDGVISSRDYIGPKENLEMKPTVQPAKFRTVTSEKTVEVEGATPMAKTIDEVAVPKDFDSTNYRHIGELPAAPLKPMEMAEAKTKTVTTTRRVLVSPAINTATTATVYGSPHGSERQVVSSELQGQIMKPQEGADGVLTASELGVQEDEFRRLALAEYDTNKDGTVTVEEAVANVDPLIDPNDAAVRHSVFSATTAINSGDSNGR